MRRTGSPNVVVCNESWLPNSRSRRFILVRRNELDRETFLMSISVAVNVWNCNFGSDLERQRFFWLTFLNGVLWWINVWVTVPRHFFSRFQTRGNFVLSPRQSLTLPVLCCSISGGASFQFATDGTSRLGSGTGSGVNGIALYRSTFLRRPPPLWSIVKRSDLLEFRFHFAWHERRNVVQGKWEEKKTKKRAPTIRTVPFSRLVSHFFSALVSSRPKLFPIQTVGVRGRIPLHFGWRNSEANFPPSRWWWREYQRFGHF